MDNTLLTLNASDQLAVSFVPTIIRKKYNSDERAFTTDDHATLLWIDIASFSPLCNRLMKDSTKGVEAITAILKKHYDFVLSAIAGYGGQPLVFAGDGVMAAWPGDKKGAEAAVAQAVSCAHRIITERTTADDAGNLLSLHLIVSVGPWQMTELEGVQGACLYSFFGEVFSTIATAAKNKAPNEILITDVALSCLRGGSKSKALLFDTSVLLDYAFLSPKGEEEELQLSEEAAQKLTAFVPRTLSLPLNKKRLEWIAELRPVTILYVRMPNGGGDASANLQQLHKSVAAVRPLVMKYDGLLNQVWIDEKESNILICFGPPPSAHNYSPERAVHLALEIQAVLRQGGFDNSIGVCTGMAYCGILGNDHLRQYTVIGDVVNMSAHVTGLDLNTVYCDKATYLNSAKTVRFTGPLPKLLKGRSEPVQLYVPEGLLTDAFIGNGNIAMVGRKAELAVLSEALNDAVQGESACVIIEGESGMGKTKLLEEFLLRNASGNGAFLFGNGDFISRNTPYGVMGNVFFSMLGLHQDAYARDHKQMLNFIAKKYANKASLLNAVLQTDFPETDEVKNLTPAQKVAATHDFLLLLVKEQTLRHPVTIILDDAQWVDEPTWSLIEAVNHTLSRCLILLSFREGERASDLHTEKLKNAKRIRLAELPDEDQEKIVAAKLGVSKLSGDVSSLIKQIARGNPFFCAELADSLHEQGLISVENDTCTLRNKAAMNASLLPETVRGALRRRLDRITPGAQLSLKVASVVGTRFPAIVVRNIYPIETDRTAVTSYLKDAKQAGFIGDVVIDKMDGYHFSSPTVADVAYEMTLSEQRQLLHRQTAEWYENHFGEDLHPFYVRLADHWSKAGNKKKAVAYHEKEAIRLFRLGFVKQALDMGLEGVSLLGLNAEREPAAIGQKIGEHMAAIGSLLQGRTIESLIDHKKLENENTETIIKLLLELMPFAHQCQQVELFALMAVTSLRLTLEEGNGPSAAEVYAMYAIIYKAMTGDSQTAFAWSNLAIAVDDKAGNTLQSRVDFIHCWFVAHWMLPVRQLIPVAEGGAEAGFRSGDVLFACFNLSLCVVLKSTGGVHLEDVVETAQMYSLRNNGAVMNAAFHLMHEEQVAKAFQGRTIFYTSLTDDKYNEEENIASICNTDLYNQIGFYLTSKLKLNVHFGNWEEALAWGDKAFPVLPAFANQPGHFELEMYYALACLYRAAETKGELSTALMVKANTGIETISGWALLCPQNFAHKALLLRGIREGFVGHEAEAEALFSQAAEAARTNEFIQDCGLAYEHLARMQKRLGKDHRKALEAAKEAYTAWGADGKVSYLEEWFR